MHACLQGLLPSVHINLSRLHQRSVHKTSELGVHSDRDVQKWVSHELYHILLMLCSGEMCTFVSSSGSLGVGKQPPDIDSLRQALKVHTSSPVDWLTLVM